MRQDLDLQQEQPLTTYGTTQSPKKRIVRLRCPAFTSEEWRAKNPLLQKGEFGVESDTHSVKVGDGVTRWLGLPYTSSAGSMAWGNIGGDINNQLDLTDALSTKANTADVQAMVDEAVGDITFEVFSVGQEGLVPAPTASDATKCLLGDGSWGTPGDIGGGDSLPDQTDNEGALLTTDGTNPQWTGFVGYVGDDTFDDKQYAIILDPANKQTSDYKTGLPRIAINPQGDTASYGTNIGGTASSTASTSIGSGSRATNFYTVAVGTNANASGNHSTAVGYGASATNTSSIQLGQGQNNTNNTFSVGLSALNNYRLLEADGTIPAERMSSTVGTTGQVLTKTDTGMEWQDSAGGATGDYLPLSGGTLTGALNIKPEVSDTFGEVLTLSYGDNDVVIAKNRYGKSLSLDGTTLAVTHLARTGIGDSNIGTPTASFSNIYVAKISGSTSYSDTHYLLVPNKDGTIATVEDIDAAVGDISTALTSILGE